MPNNRKRPDHCSSCGLFMLAENDPADGLHYGARGVCKPCYYRAWRQGELEDLPSLIVPNEGLVQDLLILRNRGYTLQRAADTLGVTYKALEQALCRYRRKQRQDVAPVYPNG
jgi:hypothetical protein